MTEPRISVIMSVYNNEAYLAAAIESILEQTFGDFEFLIVDDGSTDGSGPIMDSYAARDARIRVTHQRNQGLVASLNRMIYEARAPLIARKDGDDIAMPERLARQLAFLDEHPDHGVVGSWTRCIDETGAERQELCRDHPTSHEALLDSLDRGPLLCHSSVVMRADILRSVGGYRPQYRHCEDYDLWLRLVERTRITSIAERLMLYRHSDEQVSSRHILEQHYGAATALEAHKERVRSGRDPTDGLARLPPVDGLDALFGRPGLGKAIRERVALGIVYSPLALRGEGYEMLMAHVREGGRTDGLWRTAGRLFKFGEPARALKLIAALAAQ